MFSNQHPGANPYSYIINGVIEELIGGNEKRLYLRNDKAAEQFRGIRKKEIPLLLPGTYPAIETLDFALVEARDDYNYRGPVAWYEIGDYDDDDFDEDEDVLAWANQPGK